MCYPAHGQLFRSYHIKSNKRQILICLCTDWKPELDLSLPTAISDVYPVEHRQCKRQKQHVLLGKNYSHLSKFLGFVFLVQDNLQLVLSLLTHTHGNKLHCMEFCKNSSALVELLKQFFKKDPHCSINEESKGFLEHCKQQNNKRDSSAFKL